MNVLTTSKTYNTKGTLFEMLRQRGNTVILWGGILGGKVICSIWLLTTSQTLNGFTLSLTRTPTMAKSMTTHW